MKNLSENQQILLIKLKLYMTHKQPMQYDRLKALCEFKTFDATFNALLNKKYVKRHILGDGNNTYILN